MHRLHCLFRTPRAGLAVLVLSLACAPASLVDVTVPSTLVDPATVQSATGATQLYDLAITNFAMRLGATGLVFNCAGEDSYITNTGSATDELMMSGRTDAMDTRTWDSLNNGCQQTYPIWHQPRVEARQAREALRLYAPATPQAWQGRLYSTEAFAVLWFAEFYCSGIPMSLVSLFGSATPTAGFTTDQLFQYANALFDTAMTLSADSVRFLRFAKVGKGRALLGLGRFADAAAAVQDVPTDFVYNTEHNSAGLSGGNGNGIGSAPRFRFTQDNEGGTGLVWSADPRPALVTTPSLSGAMRYSAKYSRTASGVLDPTQTVADNPVRAADGLEARLIEAESDLAAGGSNWLTILNTLRSTCIGTSPCAPVPGLTAALLPPLADPGTPGTRLDLAMRERAMWLFLTGHRFGDLRRLTHVYHRDQNLLWPTGTYNNPGFLPQIAASPSNGQSYGTAVVMVPPPATSGYGEAGNSLYTGCVNYDP